MTECNNFLQNYNTHHKALKRMIEDDLGYSIG